MRLYILILLFPLFIWANELKNSTSPYLLQHKDNPVDWMEWSDRAFKKAKKENKLIFLSIGYSTCHWCHVMAKDSFEKKEVADILNRYFVSIKVDRERRVDLDTKYQREFNIVNGRGGGWPLTVIMLPNKEPIFFGTFIPKDSLIDLLKQIVKSGRKKQVLAAKEIQRVLKYYNSAKLANAKPPKDIVKLALKEYKVSFDKINGGFGSAPKFPQPALLNTLIDIYEITKDKSALHIINKSLTAMAKGGIYDQIEGGFFRYSVDSKWQIPHFEKMLYSNAELISLYSRAYKLTKNKLYSKVVKESIANIEKYFQKDGHYFSASNADSKNEDKEEQEGYYYVYEYDRVLNYLIKHGVSKKVAKEALDNFGIESMGNFEGGDYSNPRVKGSAFKFTKIRQLLVKYRKEKEYPFIDKKVNTAWNALYIKALFDATVVDKNYLHLAKSRLDSLMALMYKKSELYHQTLMPHKPIQKGLLEDYAFVADALFSAYQKSLDNRYKKLYAKIVKSAVNKFYKNDNWYIDTKHKVKAEYQGGSYKSAAAKMIENSFKYVAIIGDYKLLDIAKKSLKKAEPNLANGAIYYASLLRCKLIDNYGLYVVKATKEVLPKIDFKNITYPYIYKEPTEYKKIQICGISSCFVTFDNYIKTEDELKKLIHK